MKGSNKQLIYWDTGIFIAWLSSENRDLKEVNAITNMFQRFEENKILICTSIVTLVEILPSQLGYTNYKKFEDFLKRSNFQIINTDRKIGTIARDIRDYYSKNKDVLNTTVTQPDAIHLATAINYGCDCFYTLDAQDKKGRSRGLLPLNGTIAGTYFLQIERPGFGTFKI
jgi:predicted nucleic acid-binding protein